MAVPKTIQLKYLSSGNKFRITGWTSKYGEFIEYFEGCDVKVRIFNGNKSEISWYASGAEVFLVSDSDLVIPTVEVKQPGIEQSANNNVKVKLSNVAPVVSTESKTDKWGCRRTSISGMINAVMSKNPQTLDEIANKLGISPGRVLEHFDAWKDKKKGIALVLREKDNKYWIVD